MWLWTLGGDEKFSGRNDKTHVIDNCYKCIFFINMMQWSIADVQLCLRKDERWERFWTPSTVCTERQQCRELPDWSVSWSQFCYLCPLSLPPCDKSEVTQSQSQRLIMRDWSVTVILLIVLLARSVQLTKCPFSAASQLLDLVSPRTGQEADETRLTIFACRSITTVLARMIQLRQPPAAPRAAASPPARAISSLSSSSPS